MSRRRLTTYISDLTGRSHSISWFGRATWPTLSPLEVETPGVMTCRIVTWRLHSNCYWTSITKIICKQVSAVVTLWSRVMGHTRSTASLEWGTGKVTESQWIRNKEEEDKWQTKVKMELKFGTCWWTQSLNVGGGGDDANLNTNTGIVPCKKVKTVSFQILTFPFNSKLHNFCNWNSVD